MIYEVGSIRFFTELDEFDEIVVEFERTPFGGSLQQTVAGLWLEYSYIPTPKTEKEEQKFDRFERLIGRIDSLKRTTSLALKIVPSDEALRVDLAGVDSAGVDLAAVDLVVLVVVLVAVLADTLV